MGNRPLGLFNPKSSASASSATLAEKNRLRIDFLPVAISPWPFKNLNCEMPKAKIVQNPVAGSHVTAPHEGKTKSIGFSAIIQ
jgi:hypothetical protein